MYFNSINTHWRYKNVGWVGFGVRQCAVNGGSEILASDWPSQFDFDQWSYLYVLEPTLEKKISRAEVMDAIKD